MDEIMVRENITLTNKTLKTATNKILSLGEKVKSALFEVAAIIAQVDREGAFQEDGFSSVHEWTEKCFGYKKSQSYAMLNIGKDWTEAKVNQAGKITGYVSAIDSGFSTTQIQQMIPAGRAMAQELYDEKLITPEMTVKEIHEVIKAAMSVPQDAEEDELEEVDEEGADEVQEAEVLIHVVDDQGVAYEVPASVLYQYKI